jgi:PTH1 family peptidyl-tRNA hydrolase
VTRPPKTAPAGAAIRLLAGLGNPGASYAGTRHNAGFLLVDRLAALWDIDPPVAGPEPDIAWASATAAGPPVVIAKPLAYMNRSGPPLRRLADALQIPVQAVMVVHDDVDLVFGRIKIKQKGGDGGHRGLMSLIDAFGRDDFVRLRIGIGRPAPGQTAVEHVLSGFTPEEASAFEAILARGCEAAAFAIQCGAAAAMNRFNANRGSHSPGNQLNGGQNGCRNE